MTFLSSRNFYAGLNEALMRCPEADDIPQAGWFLGVHHDEALINREHTTWWDAQRGHAFHGSQLPQSFLWSVTGTAKFIRRSANSPRISISWISCSRQKRIASSPVANTRAWSSLVVHPPMSSTYFNVF